MEKHKCKLCFKSFANGRALGGHMRSHMLNLPIQRKVIEEQRREEVPINQDSEESEAASASASASSSSSEEEGEDKEQVYVLRENPKRSVRVVDPEFVDAGSVVLQDRESETESSRNPTRRRSKRTRKIVEHQQYNPQQQQTPQIQGQEEETKKLKVNNNQLSKTESWVETEPVSSISDATTEEDVAFCLMMLSRDQWKSRVVLDYDDEDEVEIEKSMEEADESEEYFTISKINRMNRGKYKCETCNKVFKSYQALGGHRASHKKTKLYSGETQETELEPENVATCSMTEKKIHECPVCFRVFSSGQALGGHKRSHVTGQIIATATESIQIKTSKKLGDSLIDLNLPAPAEDDDVSAVSDAEFVNHIN